jgi:type II secretory pathway component GspD/PulD (secretin)
VCFAAPWLFMVFGLGLAACGQDAPPQTPAKEVPAPAPEFKAYPLNYADGPATVETIKGLVGADARVAYDPATRKLLVMAGSHQHATIARLVEELNLPPRNVRIIVRFEGAGSEDTSSASVSGQGGVVVTRQGTRSSVRIQPRIEQQHTETTSSAQQQLLVTSGRQATLFVGENVPYLEWIMDYGWRHHHIEQHVVWQQVGAYLVIEPVILGNGSLIRVKLTPELSGRVDGNPYRTRLATATTEVTASDGVPFSLGGLARTHEFYSRFLIGRDRNGRRQTLDIEMTAHIETPAQPPK